MKIVFRCDASSDIGLGHLIRCLAVAKELKRSNHIIFATIEDDTNSYIRDSNFEIFFKKPFFQRSNFRKRFSKGFKESFTKEKLSYIYKNETEEAFLERINSILKPDIIVIDKKYPYSAECLKDLKRNKTKIVMVDNICEGLSASDEIIFPNAHLGKNLLKKYLSQERIARVKTGPEYVILRDEILALKNLSFKKKALPKKYYTLYPIKNKVVHNLHTPPNIVITTGGTDPEGVLIKLIPWLKEMDLDANILILVGQGFKFQNELEHLIGTLPDNFQIIPYSLQELIKGDIVICTFGVSIYEMIYLQIPTICISHSIENAYGARILREGYGIIEDMGYVKDVDSKGLYMTITRLLTDRVYYMDMVARCGNLIDEKGAKRLGQIIVGGEHV